MQTLFIALSLSFCWVNYINPFAAALFSHYINMVNPFAHKPFNCTTCMCGWFAAIIGCYIHGPTGLLYLPAGVFTGAMFNAISMRWL